MSTHPDEPSTWYKLPQLHNHGETVQIEIPDTDLSDALYGSISARERIENRYKAEQDIPARSIDARTRWAALKPLLLDQVVDEKELHARARETRKAPAKEAGKR